MLLYYTIIYILERERESRVYLNIILCLHDALLTTIYKFIVYFLPSMMYIILLYMYYSMLAYNTNTNKCKNRSAK